MGLRLVAILCAGLVATCLWSSPQTVHVEGKVSLTACPGNPPRNLPPGTSPCSTEAIQGATVMLAPMHGSVMTAETVAGGRYWIDVSPGTYIVAVIGPTRLRFASQPSWVMIPNRPTLRLDLPAYLPVV